LLINVAGAFPREKWQHFDVSFWNFIFFFLQKSSSGDVEPQVNFVSKHLLLFYRGKY